MTTAPILSKGQMTIPKDVREFLQVEPGNLLMFHPAQKEVMIRKGDINENILTNKALVTQKGQVTLPKGIRTLLQLEEGDTLVFSCLNENIYFRKQGLITSCPICNGVGSLDDGKFPCFVCDQTGEIEKTDMGILFTIFFQIPSRKYQVGISSIGQELNGDGTINIRQFPKLTVHSSNYPTELLHEIQDKLQMLLVEENTPKSISDSSKFMIPSDSLLNDILSLFVTENAKETVRNWFRYERTI